ncbi:MAG: MFS transporter, partial [Erysipelotrichaceae bacterium]|nr:MFS transporter [Erysipelotrichaceae bacterium]
MKNRSSRHWIILGFMCLLTGAGIGICTNTVGVFYTPVSESLGVLRGTAAIQSTISLITTGFVSLLLPALMKKLPYKLILTAGSLLAVLATAAMGLCQTIGIFNLLGVLRGVGAAAFTAVPVTMIINNWFEKRNGFAISTALSFSGVIGAAGSPILAACIARFGWQTAYLVQAGMILLLTLPAIVFPVPLHPRQAGLLPYGAEENSGKPDKKKTGHQARGGFRFLSAGFVCLAVMTLLHTSISGISQHMTGLAEHVGFSAGVGAAMVSMAMIGNIVFKLIIGVLSDRFGPVKACIIMIAANAVSIVMIYAGGLVHTRFLLLSGALLYGTVYAVGAAG